MKIGEHEVELRMTLLSLKRLREATGFTSRQLNDEMHEIYAGAEEGASEEARNRSMDALERRFQTYLWALVSHHDSLGQMTEDEVAGSIELHEMEPIGVALAVALAGANQGPPPAARGRKAAPPRRKK